MNNQLIVQPKGGWVGKSWYLIDVAYRPGNPVHRSLLYTGFLDKFGKPGSYSFIQTIAYAETHRVNEPMYIKALKVVVSRDDLTREGVYFAPNDRTDKPKP